MLKTKFLNLIRDRRDSESETVHEANATTPPHRMEEEKESTNIDAVSAEQRGHNDETRQIDEFIQSAPSDGDQDRRRWIRPKRKWKNIAPRSRSRRRRRPQSMTLSGGSIRNRCGSDRLRIAVKFKSAPRRRLSPRFEVGIEIRATMKQTG